MVILSSMANFLVAQGIYLQQLQLTGLPWLNVLFLSVLLLNHYTKKSILHHRTFSVFL